MTQYPTNHDSLKLPQWLAVLIPLLTLVSGPTATFAQVPPKVVALKPGEKLPEPATVEEAAKVLDLRTIPLIEGAKTSIRRTLGLLMYNAPGTPKTAFEFQRQLLKKLGFQESPKGNSDATSVSGDFTKNGFLVRVSTSAAIGEPQKTGWSSVTLVNEGNVALDKLPVPPGAKPFHPTSYEASYTTIAKPAETAAACRKLLLAEGWEPYGETKSPHPGQPDALMQYFKRNAIKLQSWIMTTPAEGGKTLIRYDAELLSADLPAPADAVDTRYDDSQKTLRFASPADQTDAVIAYYQQRLPKQGWKATTENPIVDDAKKTRFLIYRNSQMDLLALDLKQYQDNVEIKLRHQSAAEVAEEDRLAKEKAELAQQELANKNRKVNVAIPLPALAKKLKKQGANKIEFSLATGSGPKTLEAFRTHFAKEGWTDRVYREFGETSGILIFTKDFAKFDVSYFDLGRDEMSITVEGTKNVVLEPQPSADQVAQAQPPAKKPPTPAIPGLPELPPGVELPDEVKAQLQKALKGLGDLKPNPPKTSSPPKKPDSANQPTAPAVPNVPAATPKTPATPKVGSPLRKVKETPLGEYDLTTYRAKTPTLWLSPDGRRVAYLTEKGIVIDGQHKEYDYFVDPKSFTFSPDSKHTAYAARVKRPKSDTNYILVVDGKESAQAYHSISSGPLFSPDSKNIAFVGRRWTVSDYENFVVIDGKEGEPQSSFAWEMTFTTDGKRLVYGVKKDGKESNYTMREQTVDGSQKPIDHNYGPAILTGNFFYGPARQMGYIGKAGDKQFLVVYDGKEDPNRYYDIKMRNVVVSDDGKHVAFVAESGLFKYVVVANGQPSQELSGVVDRSLAISPDGKRVGYATKDFGKIQAVIDGQAGKVYRGVVGITFSPDGKRVGYTAVAGDKWHAVIDGQEGPGYDGLGFVAFSPDSKSVAIGAELGKRQFILLNGQPQINGIVQKGYEETGGPRFSPDGKRLVYRAKAGGKWLVVDSGKEQTPYKDVVDEFYFSADGRRLAAVVTDDDGEMVVVDGLEGNRYDFIFTIGGGEVFFDKAEPGDANGGRSFHYIAQKGEKVVLVEETIQD